MVFQCNINSSCSFGSNSIFLLNVSQEILIQNGVNGGGGRRLNAFAKSLARCEMWHPSGGKSGTTFYKTKDDR